MTMIAVMTRTAHTKLTKTFASHSDCHGGIVARTRQIEVFWRRVTFTVRYSPASRAVTHIALLMSRAHMPADPTQYRGSASRRRPASALPHVGSLAMRRQWEAAT